jgi:glycosyltransferase involved in cell wall biosynthesis
MPEAAHLLRAFDIFVLPSKKEGLPYVLLEAGLAGLPVVASDLPGNLDIIDTGETGLLIAPEALAGPLQMLVRDEGMRRRLGHALNAHVTTTFSLETMITKTLALYTENGSSTGVETVE